MSLSDSDMDRYQRQLLIEGWDQEKLKNASVLIVGLGGLGCVSAAYLAAAGVGHLKLCDNDKVELSNLNRQVLYFADDIGMPKAEQAARRLAAFNPGIRIETVAEKFEEQNMALIVSGSNLIIDGLDNHTDRLALNRISCGMNIPFIYGAINGWQGQVGFFNPPKTACLACIMPENIKGPTPVPVFGALPGTIGSIQATLALEYLMKSDVPLQDQLLIYHSDRMVFESVAFEKRHDCKICGDIR